MALLVAERTEGRRRPLGLGTVLGMLAIAGVPAALILLQPDLGTMLVLSATIFGVLAVAGTPRRWLALLVAGGVTVAVAMVAEGFLKAVFEVDKDGRLGHVRLEPMMKYNDPWWSKDMGACVTRGLEAVKVPNEGKGSTVAETSWFLTPPTAKLRSTLSARTSE